MITTLESVKTAIGITGPLKDSQITALIPMVESDYLAVRNKAFDTVDGSVVYPEGAEFTAIKMIEYHIMGKPIQGALGMVASESLGRYSVSYATVTGMYPDSILKRITRYVSFV